MGGDLARTARWAALTLDAADAQVAALRAPPARSASDRTAAGDPVLTAWSESAAAMLAAELGLDGLPVDRAAAERILAELIGDRPASAEEAERDPRPTGTPACSGTCPPASTWPRTDLRNPAQVRALLARVGLDLPDTRSWRLERHAGEHPLVDALLAWRKAERIATTYGYGWLDRHVGADGRLRGGGPGATAEPAG